MEEKFLTIDKDSIQMLQGNIDDYPCGIVIPIDKPYRWTSADVVRKVKFIAQKHFHKKNLKVGHAGTLDPLATGVLLVCIGKATKQAEALQAEQKEYLAQIELGATTPCFDMEKEIADIPLSILQGRWLRRLYQDFWVSRTRYLLCFRQS